MLDTLLVKFDQFLEIINFPVLIQFLVLIGWVVMIKSLKIKYNVSITIALSLIILAIAIAIFNMNLAGFFGEYAFMFLLVGSIQILFVKEKEIKNA